MTASTASYFLGGRSIPTLICFIYFKFQSILSIFKSQQNPANIHEIGNEIKSPESHDGIIKVSIVSGPCKNKLRGGEQQVPQKVAAFRTADGQVRLTGVQTNAGWLGAK